MLINQSFISHNRELEGEHQHGAVRYVINLKATLFGKYKNVFTLFFWIESHDINTGNGLFSYMT